MTEQPEGMIDPPIDDLVTKADSKYSLVLFAAKRARQINNYYAQLHEGLFEHIGPLVETQLNEKPLSIALREINEDLLTQKSPAQAVESEAA
ncbi:MAG: DNA-directed RNA polymerase subunit omega [Nesterenkonia sp.]